MNRQGECCQQGGPAKTSLNHILGHLVLYGFGLLLLTMSLSSGSTAGYLCPRVAQTRGRAAAESVHRLMTGVQGMGPEPVAPVHSEVSVS